MEVKQLEAVENRKKDKRAWLQDKRTAEREEKMRFYADKPSVVPNPTTYQWIHIVWVHKCPLTTTGECWTTITI